MKCVIFGAVASLVVVSSQQQVIRENIRALDQMNETYSQLKNNQEKNNVLRYIGDLSGNLEDENGATLEVKLVSAPQSSPLGALKGSDSIFEIYTESYGEQPLVIQGAGAGAQVTARGVFGDVLRLVENNN